jgi:hypothetical protein
MHADRNHSLWLNGSEQRTNQSPAIVVLHCTIVRIRLPLLTRGQVSSAGTDRGLGEQSGRRAASKLNDGEHLMDI